MWRGGFRQNYFKITLRTITCWSILYNELISIKTRKNARSGKKKKKKKGIVIWEKRCDSEACGMCICLVNYLHLPTYEICVLIEWKENVETIFILQEADKKQEVLTCICYFPCVIQSKIKKFRCISEQWLYLCYI